MVGGALRVISMFTVVLASGCAGVSSTGREAVTEAVPDVRSVERAPSEGSLWTDAQSRTFFFEDVKAARVGDAVRVRIVENASGSKDAKTSTGRSSSVEAGTNSFLGIPGTTVNDLRADASYASAFDGNGTTSRSGALTADVTAIVTAVLPNGNLVIEGSRDVVINRETERIRLRGTIRPADIGPRNVILSNVIADAKIEYSGSGVLSDNQHPGWLTRVLAWLWPF